MMKLSILAAAAAFVAGPALAQGAVSTAPTPTAPSGVTRDQGAGSQGMAATPGVPMGGAGTQTQMGTGDRTPGRMDTGGPSGGGASGSGAGGGAAGTN